MADSWDSSLYDDRHSFVWKKAGDLIDILDPKSGEAVLDLGCGTGHLTAAIAERGVEVTGIDSSVSMVAQARQNYPKLRFVLADAAAGELPKELETRYDAVFSNAVLHWIKDAEAVARNVAMLLKPGGRFVLEMGARHNIEYIEAVLCSTLAEAGYELRNPWYFPGLGEYCSILERVGFEVSGAWTFQRMNKLEHPERGMREWLEMFAGSWFDVVPAAKRAGIMKQLEDRLRPTLFRDGAWWADYRRLRVVARLSEPLG